METRIALITGASRGLGRSMALHLAASGVDLVGTFRSHEAAAAAVAREIEAYGRRAAMLRLDVGRAATFPAFVDALTRTLRDTFGRAQFDILVNNAGAAGSAPIAEVTEAEFDELVNVHFKGPFFLTQRLLPLIADGGRIINVSTGLARFTYPGRAAYAANKGAVEVFTRYLAKELGPRGITANVVAPGAIATDFGGGVVRDDPDVNRQVAAAIALGRVGEADDVGGAVAALVSDGGRWINGQRIEVSGGQNL
jgi:NAD(P)-dependent dehydrogenase (short-subunit alcohol dehydrogenase family)